MKKTEVVEALVQMRSAKQKWAVAQTAFTADFEAVMKRLINEAAVNKMSAEEVAKACGLTLKRVRQFMRENNLNPRNSKALLAKTAAETLETNAALLGVEPRDFDLTSPLAYLPMGSQLRDFLRNAVDPDEVLVEEVDPKITDGFWCRICQVFEDDGQGEVTTTVNKGHEICQGCGCPPEYHVSVNINEKQSVPA